MTAGAEACAGKDGADGGAGADGPDCFERWREVMGRSRAAEMTSDHAATFTATVRQARLGPVTLLATAFPSIRVRRTGRMIRRSDEEVYHLTMLTSGSAPTRTLTPGHMHLVTSSQPYDSRFRAAPGAEPAHPRTEGIGIDLPVSLLPLPPRRVSHLLGRVLHGHEGTGSLLTAFLHGLDRQLPALRPAEAARLGSVVVDLLAAHLASELDVEDALPPETRQRAMLHDVRAFIRQNLHDPALTPSMIAAAHHVSLSYLHRLFTRDSHGTTLVAAIRHQRLTKAYRDLLDPALRSVPIHVIAARCGFTHASAFTRAFKTAYGIAPSDHRHGHTAPPTPGPRALHERGTRQ
ncbi:AraC family transcriptional regulator [Streptomyces sp. NBC_00083]|uniref:AraC family transcriptional regulator n=1 Tax=Streptomyces sp. NBC_00083 TaxID=2975647 RepID=UPI00224EE580|nr:AraC family transcriptional regulator [Streptomyces sp. NBC_00083]MCX5384800.1 AraC family transcriptional regulator [Streptomyces sp. NBC_00083]